MTLNVDLSFYLQVVMLLELERDAKNEFLLAQLTASADAKGYYNSDIHFKHKTSDQNWHRIISYFQNIIMTIYRALIIKKFRLGKIPICVS